MGVRGLTTYIYSNSNKYFENYCLKNSDLVIDGNCLATILFYNSITNTASFGGDYDKYAKATENFFNQLSKCNINAIVIFDGGYERKKLDTVYLRNKNKIISLSNAGPTNHSKQCFPLMMRQVFRDKLKEMNIAFAQSDFEADSEIAALARKFQCPVLSNDSDFFIYDVEMIPITEFPLEADLDGNGSYHMSCKIYRVEKFLKSLGGLPKSHLPLLAALLGNDYISTSTFANFYSQMKISRGRKQSQIHCRVQSIISWLKRESFESALKKILWHLKKQKQRFVAIKVARIIQDYSQVSTPLDAYVIKNEDKHLDIEILNVEDILVRYDNINENANEDICDEDGVESGNSNCSDESAEHSNEESSVEDETNVITELENKPLKTVNRKKLRETDFFSNRFENFPDWLVEHSRKGNLPNSIFTMLSLKIYYSVPQVENYDMSHAGEIGLPILSKLAGILLGDDVFSYYSRTQKARFGCKKIATVTLCGKKKLPNVSNLYQLNNTQRKNVLLDVFEIDSNTQNIILNFPDKWHLVLLSFVYWAKNIQEINFQCYYLHSFITMIICIRVIENKIGYFRNKRPFMQRYASKMKKCDITCSLDSTDSVQSIIDAIPLEECLTAFEIFLPYFQVEEKLKTNMKFFSKTTIHAFAQFQVCLDLAVTLNSLLLFPIQTLPIYNFFNSTFLYNFCTNFKKRTNIPAYLDTLFVKCPTLLLLHKKMSELLTSVVSLSEKPETVKKRRRRKKNSKHVDICLIGQKSDEEISSYSDDDNAFSLLSKLSIK